MSSSDSITSNVDAASAKFKVMQGNLKLLVDALEAHHQSMMDLRERRVNLAKQLDFFVADSPLSEVVGEFGTSTALSPSSSHKFDMVTAQVEFEEEDIDMRSREDTTSSSSSSLTTSPSSPPSSPESTKKECVSPICISESVVQLEAPVRVPTEEELMANDDDDEESTPVAEHTFPAESSYASVSQKLYEVDSALHKQYYADIVVYAQAWLKTTSDRVMSRQLQFQELKKKLVHYQKKVQTLEAKNKGEIKLERNNLKLRGAKEAFENAGESLLLLLEEVTERAWKDMYPLLQNLLQFDVQHSTSVARATALLQQGSDHLTLIEKCENLGNRLHKIETCHPEELYTGEKRLVRPVLGSIREAVPLEL